MDLHSLASIGVLTANAVFMIIAVAGYLKMNTHESRRQQYLAHALAESRDAGLELRGVARELMRMIERADRSVAWQRQALQPGAAGTSFELDGAEPDAEKLRGFESLAGVTEAEYEQWRRRQQVELERVLHQRRRLQQELDAARRRADEAERQSGRSRSERSLRERTELKSLQQQLHQTQSLLTECKDMLRHAEARAALAESTGEVAVGEAARLREQIAELDARMRRQQCEKEFIEDHLLALDQLVRKQSGESGMDGERSGAMSA